MSLKRVGHVALMASNEERSRAFYRDVMGLAVSDQDPEHGGTFMPLGENFHTIDVFPNPEPGNEPMPQRGQVGLFHLAFEA